MYICTARPICLLFERQVASRAFSRACANTGNRIAARMAIMAITTSNSMRVNPARSLRVPVQSWGTDGVPGPVLFMRVSFPAGNELGAMFAAGSGVSLLGWKRQVARLDQVAAGIGTGGIAGPDCERWAG